MRDQIVREIRRLAAANNGKAPSKRAFLKETGISESDWYGKFWSRWNDAISDAGLTPNEQQVRLSDDIVLDDYAKVCRHYGKPPSNAELRLFARANKGFTSHNTFSKHFGSKEGVVVALRERAIELGEEDLLSILPQPKQLPASKQHEKHASVANGWVYLLRSGAYFKIGRSSELEKRVKQISVAMPEKVILEHAIQTDDTSGIEAYWHRRFASQRVNGEWFELSASDVRAFKRRTFQ